MRRVISPSLSPNTESDDVMRALETLMMPWLWKSGDAVEQVEKWFKNYFQTQTVVSFNSGRSALLVLLQSFGIGKGDEVVVQAFTCVAVPNSVIWAGAKPVFADIDDSFNLDPVDAEKKITGKTKAIVVQHTFGIPARMDALVSIAKKYKLILIEDCAHSLGATYNGKKIGTLGDAAFFSFGRDKVISSVWGGAALINEKSAMKHAKLKFKNIQQKLQRPSRFWIFQQLLHPLAFSIILSSYNIGIGKLLLVFLQKLKLLSFPVYSEEKHAGRPNGFPATYPNALARLLLNQLQKLDQYNQERRRIAAYYHNALKSRRDILIRPLMGEALYLRYPILAQDPKEVILSAKRKGIHLGNWYHNTIDPPGVYLSRIGYSFGSCPKAEDAGRHIINLPTRISIEEARAVIEALR